MFKLIISLPVVNQVPFSDNTRKSNVTLHTCYCTTEEEAQERVDAFARNNCHM